ncbi:hypothetical protein LRH25_12870 [Ideonella azotifigens]|uniref:Phasin domain-containing protein n=1 Tax=Ideonella azotifigens TaxID=513160 RepID=A0ABP3V914_9BURK|nr:hypothetical protein [Ideonella azotifigens]MCD2341234.1 hypothetical protein [Ideonella azotifigens]
MSDPTQAMQSAIQPLVKLTQANMALLTQFSTSPEVSSLSQVNTQDLLQQWQKSSGSLMQSNAFAQLGQGLMKNYTEFFAELGQNAMSAMAQGQAEMSRRVQEAGDNVIDATSERSKRAR